MIMPLQNDIHAVSGKKPRKMICKRKSNSVSTTIRSSFPHRAHRIMHRNNRPFFRFVFQLVFHPQYCVLVNLLLLLTNAPSAFHRARRYSADEKLLNNRRDNQKGQHRYHNTRILRRTQRCAVDISENRFLVCKDLPQYILQRPETFIARTQIQ